MKTTFGWFFIYNSQEYLNSKMTMKNYWILFFILFFLSGCYPIYQKIRPYISVQVYDQSGQYIEAATVVRMTDQRPARVDTVFESQKKDAQGSVEFESQRRWAVEFMMIHGAQHYTWDICVSKSGYETKKSIQIGNDVDLKVTLKKTPKVQEPCYVDNP